MSDPGSAVKGGDMARFGKAWAQAMEASEPPFDGEASLAALQARTRSGAPRSRRGPWRVALAAAALLSIGAVLALFTLRGPPRPDAPLLQAGAYLEARPGESLPLDFAEGSRVLVEGASRVRVESVDPRGARIAVVSGGVVASIVHRPDTNWVFAAGPFTVRVTGTRLRVEWDPKDERFDVGVDEGSVALSGPLLDGERRVGAGERCQVRLAQSKVEFVPAPRASAELPGGPAGFEVPLVSVDDLPIVGSASASAGASAAPIPGSWQALERAGRYAEAVSAAEREGLEGIYATGTADELMALARAARLGARPDVSRAALLRCRMRFPSDSRASTAAFLLGRSAGPAEAARWFSTYLGEQPNGPLTREAAGRLIEAQQQAGDLRAARVAAQRYLATYPDGPHAAFARRVVDTTE